jgi:hypothetical protein
MSGIEVATITTTGGQITWESTGADAGEMTRLVDNWNHWVAGENPRSFHLVRDSGAFNVQYRDIIRIDLEGDR